MRRSEAFLATSREPVDHEREAVQLAHRAGLIEQFGSGVYGLAPTGERVQRRLVRRIEAEMDAIGGQRVSLPQLQYREAWAQSGRWGSFEGEMFTLENRDGQDMCLAPSHEEGMVELVSGHLRSYDDLPLLCYQVNTKHRDDHARNGLLRTKEFTMKDAYSFHADRESLRAWYDRVREAYCRFFDAIGLDVVIAAADNSVMGGSSSEEFVAPVENGACELLACSAADCRFGLTDEHADFGTEYASGDACPRCGTALEATEGIEVGHVFELGTRYSEPAGLTIDDADGADQHVLMGSYGIGVTRVLQTILEQRDDGDGCRWPVTDAGTVAPYDWAVIPLAYEGELREAADRLQEAGGDVLLFDDAEQSIGERFAESDLLGIPAKLVLGNHFRETGEVEVETRDGRTRYIALENAVEVVQNGAITEAIGTDAAPATAD